MFLHFGLIIQYFILLSVLLHAHDNSTDSIIYRLYELFTIAGCSGGILYRRTIGARYREKPERNWMQGVHYGISLLNHHHQTYHRHPPSLSARCLEKAWSSGKMNATHPWWIYTLAQAGTEHVRWARIALAELPQRSCPHKSWWRPRASPCRLPH